MEKKVSLQNSGRYELLRWVISQQPFKFLGFQTFDFVAEDFAFPSFTAFLFGADDDFKPVSRFGFSM